MINDILSRRVLIVLGKGGVGKSTLSAAIAKTATISDARALIMECDARAPLAATFGVASSFVPAQVAHNLDLMTLDGRAALEEYLRLVVPGRMLLKAVFASRIYQFFVQAAPGLRELMMLGKVFYDAGRTDAKAPAPSIIVVDAPASGQAMSLLKMPTAARSTFGDSVVGKEASSISKMLRDRPQLRDHPGHDRRQSFDFRNDRDSRAAERSQPRARRRDFQPDAAAQNSTPTTYRR